MNVASLVLGIVGAVLASLSLGWQAANYVLTGGRVKVVLQVGGRNHSGMITMPPERFTQESPRLLASQGFPQPIVAVKVANVGRQPVTVDRWGLVSGLGTSLYPAADSIGLPFPHRLEVGESATWAVDMRAVNAFIQATQATLTKQQVATARPNTLLGRVLGKKSPA
jgi:hypothetical protein